MARRAAEPAPHPPNGAETAFYASILGLLNRRRIPYLVGGAFAVNSYTGMGRNTKDVDIFCRAGDYLRILKAAAEAGHATEVEDERWIAKVRKGRYFCDVIFGSANLIAPVTDQWFVEKHPSTLFGVRVNLIPPTELIWSKSFIMDRMKFDGNDIAHVILAQRRHIDWKRLLSYMDLHWEVLLLHLLRFRYIYPFARDVIPESLMDELLTREQLQREIPLPRKKVCRGRIFSRDDFEIDIGAWGFADAVGDDKFDGKAHR
jgi:hypothetical protein